MQHSRAPGGQGQPWLDGALARADRGGGFGSQQRLLDRSQLLRGQRHQPCPGLAAFGHHDGFARMGGIDQAGEVGFGFMHIHDAPRHGGHGRF
jgi:hypothetical protein